MPKLLYQQDPGAKRRRNRDRTGELTNSKPIVKVAYFLSECDQTEPPSSDRSRRFRFSQKTASAVANPKALKCSAIAFHFRLLVRQWNIQYKLHKPNAPNVGLVRNSPLLTYL